MPGGRLIVALAGGLVFIAALAYGVFVYLIPFGVVTGPWSGAEGARAVAVDVALFTAFAAHHSIFARAGLRHLIARLVSPSLERSTYVWIASLLFIAVCWLWQPVPGLAWRVPPPWSAGLIGLQIVGVLLTGYSSKQLDVLDLAGVRQARLSASSVPPPVGVVRTGCYSFVRHPLYLGWVMMVWATPAMTGSRLVFALVSSAYLVLAVPFEERSLRRSLGAQYDEYSRQVRWRIVPFVY